MNQDQPENRILLMIESSAIISSMYNCNIRCVIDGKNETWLKGVDVATASSYGNTRQAILTYVDDEDKQTSEHLKGRLRIDALEGEQPHTVYINKPGSISLVLNSSKPEARAFKRWITTEVIPAILTTGDTNQNMLNSADQLYA